jgi:hypothetical protein
MSQLLPTPCGETWRTSLREATNWLGSLLQLWALCGARGRSRALAEQIKRAICPPDDRNVCSIWQLVEARALADGQELLSRVNDPAHLERLLGAQRRTPDSTRQRETLKCRLIVGEGLYLRPVSQITARETRLAFVCLRAGLKRDSLKRGRPESQML